MIDLVTLFNFLSLCNQKYCITSNSEEFFASKASHINHLQVPEYEFFAFLLTLAVLRSSETACKGGLNAGTDHHRRVILVFLQGIQQGTCKTKVTLHKVFLILWTVDACKVEYESLSWQNFSSSSGVESRSYSKTSSI